MAGAFQHHQALVGAVEVQARADLLGGEARLFA
jgi:hypothetical protein